MDAGSCVSAPGSFPFGFGRRSGQLIEPARKQQQQQQEKSNPPNIIRSPSVAGTEVSSTKSGNKPRMAHLETLEAKVSNKTATAITNGPSDLFRRTDWEFIRISFSYLRRQQNSSHRVNKTKSRLLDLNCKLFKEILALYSIKIP